MTYLASPMYSPAATDPECVELAFHRAVAELADEAAGRAAVASFLTGADFEEVEVRASVYARAIRYTDDCRGRHIKEIENADRE